LPYLAITLFAMWFDMESNKELRGADAAVLTFENDSCHGQRRQQPAFGVSGRAGGARRRWQEHRPGPLRIYRLEVD
jgi:hypothetical protein